MVKLYVEGGGDGKDLRTKCRQGFNQFLEKAGFQGKMPRIVACGTRQNAYESYCTAIDNGENALLLVDSEAAVSSQYQSCKPENWLPWAHLQQRVGDGWEKPKNATEDDCHLMVQCMENWFLADRAALSRFFGQGFQENALPSKENPIENTEKTDVLKSLKDATKNCKTKSSYDKGHHAFGILSQIDPAKVFAASPWAARFFDTLKL